MNRVRNALAAIATAPTIRMIIDVNPDFEANKALADELFPGLERAQDRLKHGLRAQGIVYFAADRVNDSYELAEVLADYVGNNIPANSQFVLCYDRRPNDLAVALGEFAPLFAGLLC